MKKYIGLALCFVLGISCTVLCMKSYQKIKKKLYKSSYTEKNAQKLFSKWDTKSLWLNFDVSGFENADKENLDVFISQNETMMIYFWATWCPFCKNSGETNSLIKQKGIPLVALPFDTDKEYFSYYVEKHERPYKNIFSVDSNGNGEFIKRQDEFDVPSIPSWWLLKNGKVEKIFIGDKGKEEIKTLLSENNWLSD